MSSSAASPAPAGRTTDAETALGRATVRRVGRRLLPFIFTLYIFNFLDRTNVGIAALQMNRDLRFTATQYGLGAGIFFLGYVLLEVPSNLILVRVGARRWIARIMITWGLIASAMTLMRTPAHFYGLRLLLGAAEAGFFPGIVYYLSQWFPARQRARAGAGFMIAIPLSAALGNPLGGWLLGLDGTLGLRGWQWLFLVEGVPSVLLGFAVLAWLPGRIEEARWLAPEQRDWLVETLRREESGTHAVPPLRALGRPLLWLLAAIYFLIVTLGYGFTFWAPTLIRDALRPSDLVTGLITGAIGLVAVVATLGVGASSDRRGERALHVGGCALLAAVGWVGAALVPNPVGRILFLAVAYVGSVAFLPAFWCLPSMLLHGAAAAAGIALVNSLGNVGGFVGPYLIGWFKDATGSASGAFLVLAGVGFAAAGLCLVLGRQPAVAVSRRGGVVGPAIPAGAPGGRT